MRWNMFSLVTTCVRGKSNSSAMLWWLPRCCQFGSVGICRLWPRIVSKAGIALGLEPRVLRCFNRKLWRPTGAQNQCEQSAVPSSSDIGKVRTKGTGVCRSGMGVRSFSDHPPCPSLSQQLADRRCFSLSALEYAASGHELCPRLG